MTDLETIVRDAALDHGREGGILILVGDNTVSLGLYGSTREHVMQAVEAALDYLRNRSLAGGSSGMTFRLEDHHGR